MQLETKSRIKIASKSTNNLRLSTRLGREDSPDVLALFRAVDEKMQKDASDLAEFRRQRERARDYQRAYRQRPEVKARRRENRAIKRAGPVSFDSLPEPPR
jgi:hypothetical protein